MAVGSIVARILTQYSDKGSKAADKDIKKLGKAFDQFAKRSAKAFGLAAAASAAFAIKIGKDAVQGAMEDQKQQIALATALRNTTGATDEAIASVVAYLDKKELLVGVDNNELIPSLQILTQATKDVTVAQKLQSLALDISAGTSKDLGAVSLALAKALGGNVGALTRLGVPLDAAAVKSKDLNAILTSLGATFAGQAEKRAGTLEFRMKTLSLSFNQILDQLGYALIPVLENFAKVVTKDILPAINKFVKANQQQLAASFAVAAEFAVQFLAVAISFGNWVANNTTLVKNLAIIILTMFAVAKVYAFVTAINKVTAAFTAQKLAAAGAAAASAAATGTSVAGTAAAVSKKNPLLAIGAFLGTVFVGNKLEDKMLDLGVKLFPNSAEAKRRQEAERIENRSTGTARRFFKGGSGGSGDLIPAISGPGTDLEKFLASLGTTMTKTAKAGKALLTEEQKRLNLKLKELGIVTTEQQEAITQMAILKNAERQNRLSKSATIGIGSSGALGSQQGASVVVNVGGSVSTENDLITAISDGLQRTSRRSLGSSRFATAIR
jgi:hypothetical protein